MPYGMKGYDGMPKSKTRCKKHRLTPKNPEMNKPKNSGSKMKKKMYKSK